LAREIEFMKTFMIGLLVLGIVMAGCESSREPADNPPEHIRKVPVNVEYVKTGTIRKILLLTGTVEGEHQAFVFPDASGRLIRYLVNEGDRVTVDQTICLVDRAVPGVDYEELKVKAPISGIVGQLSVDRGSQVAPQTPVALVADMDRVKVRVAVTERDLPHVRKRMASEVLVDAFPNEVFNGSVESVAPMVDPLSRTAQVEILLTNRGHRLKPGMLARVRLIQDKKEDVVVVNRDAVVGITGNQYVLVVEGGRASRRDVRLGITEGMRVEVIDGLAAGDTLIVVGQRVAGDGQPVEIVGGDEG
jgi:membrane fusion protein (multidrug efflux system)